MARIINIKNETHKECTCEGSSSWLEHWEIRKDVMATYCRACSEKNNLLGAHVINPYKIDGTTYIIPLCTNCFEQEGELNVWSHEELVTDICSSE